MKTNMLVIMSIFLISGICAEVNLSTGGMYKRIPLANVKGKRISLPISADYQAGIKLEQNSGSIGLGFDLNAGGYIERIPVGSSDENTKDAVSYPIEQWEGYAPEIVNGDGSSDFWFTYQHWNRLLGNHSNSYTSDTKLEDGELGSIQDMERYPNQTGQQDYYVLKSPYIAGQIIFTVDPTTDRLQPVLEGNENIKIEYNITDIKDDLHLPGYAGSQIILTGAADVLSGSNTINVTSYTWALNGEIMRYVDYNDDLVSYGIAARYALENITEDDSIIINYQLANECILPVKSCIYSSSSLLLTLNSDYSGGNQNAVPIAFKSGYFRRKRIAEWTITDEHGTKYVFNRKTYRYLCANDPQGLFYSSHVETGNLEDLIESNDHYCYNTEGHNYDRSFCRFGYSKKTFTWATEDEVESELLTFAEFDDYSYEVGYNYYFKSIGLIPLANEYFRYNEINFSEWLFDIYHLMGLLYIVYTDFYDDAVGEDATFAGEQIVLSENYNLGDIARKLEDLGITTIGNHSLADAITYVRCGAMSWNSFFDGNVTKRQWMKAVYLCYINTMIDVNELDMLVGEYETHINTLEDTVKQVHRLSSYGIRSWAEDHYDARVYNDESISFDGNSDENGIYVNKWYLSGIFTADYEDNDGVPGPSAGDQGDWMEFLYETHAEAGQDSFYQYTNPLINDNEAVMDNYVLNSINRFTTDFTTHTTPEYCGCVILSDPCECDYATFVNSFTTSSSYYREMQLHLSEIRTTEYRVDFETVERRDYNEYNYEDKYQKAISGIRINKRLPSGQYTLENRVAFNQDYSLCPNAPQSAVGNGKLTLNCITWYDHTNKQINEVGFTYQKNHPYNKHHHDFFGYYSAPDRAPDLVIDNALIEPTTYDPEYMYNNAIGIDKPGICDAGAWSMNGIVYNNDTKEIIEYEPNSFNGLTTGRAVWKDDSGNPFAIHGGGIRVLNVRKLAGNSCTETAYRYRNGFVPYSIPLLNGGIYSRYNYMVNSDDGVRNHYLGNITVAYDTVEVINNKYGYMQYVFSSPSTRIDDKFCGDSDFGLTDYSYLRGVLLHENLCDNEGSILEKKTYGYIINEFDAYEYPQSNSVSIACRTSSYTGGAPLDQFPDLSDMEKCKRYLVCGNVLKTLTVDTLFNINGTYTNSEEYGYNSEGLINQLVITNNESNIITTSTYAYEHYNGVNDPLDLASCNMLQFEHCKRVYDDRNADKVADPGELVKCNYIEWQEDVHGNVAPYSTIIWLDENKNGVEDTEDAYYANTIVRDAEGNVVQTEGYRKFTYGADGMKLFQTGRCDTICSVYGDGRVRPHALATNCTNIEVRYDDFERIDPIWPVCVTQAANEAHMGSYSGKSFSSALGNAYEITIPFYGLCSPEYTFEAHVKAYEVDDSLRVELIALDAAGDQLSSVNSVKYPDGAIGDWCHLATNIKLQEYPLISNVLARITNYGPNGTAAYFDNVRFYPSDAKIKTMHYDNYGNLTSMLDATGRAVYANDDVHGDQSSLDHKCRVMTAKSLSIKQ